MEVVVTVVAGRVRWVWGQRGWWEVVRALLCSAGVQGSGDGKLWGVLGWVQGASGSVRLGSCIDDAGTGAADVCSSKVGLCPCLPAGLPA